MFIYLYLRRENLKPDTQAAARDGHATATLAASRIGAHRVTRDASPVSFAETVRRGAADAMRDDTLRDTCAGAKAGIRCRCTQRLLRRYLQQARLPVAVHQASL